MVLSTVVPAGTLPLLPTYREKNIELAYLFLQVLWNSLARTDFKLLVNLETL